MELPIPIFNFQFSNTKQVVFAACFASILVFFLDRLTKFLVMRSAIEYEVNQGFAFGILREQRDLNLALNAGLLAMLFALVLWLGFKEKARGSLVILVPLAAIFGGALSNFLDRIFFDGVVDFLNFLFIPTFNLADVVITVGAVAVGLILVFGKERFWKDVSRF